MITWMQNNKKYLIVTLWISAIAFIGAGFVGWGSYQYGSKSQSIARVGEVDIKMSELQITYSNLYGYYSQMFGGNFDEAMAKQLRLEENAFNILKREALMINLAKEYGLRVLDEEIAENIFKNENFFKEGKFNREQYELILKNSRLTPKEYEARLSKVILISKLKELLKISVTPFEEEVISSITKLQDKLEIKILTVGDVEVEVSESDIRASWELTKNSYMSDEVYNVSYIETPLLDKIYSATEIEEFYNTNALEYSDSLEKVKSQVIEDMLKKDSKKDAMRDYISFKKGEFSGDVSSDTITAVNLLLSPEDMNELKTLQTGDVMKPKYSNGRYITVKLDSIKAPEVEPFEKVSHLVKSNLELQKREEKLLEVAKAEYQNFSGEKTDYLDVTGVDKIKGLFPQEASQLLNTIFTQSVDAGFVKLGSKVAMYRVLEQKISDSSSEDIDKETITNLKEQILDNNLIKKLEYHYPVETYFKG